jgi:mannose-6-phosphate isomerase class I
VQPVSTALADRLLEGDRALAAELAAGLLKPRRDNLVERPWGGSRLRAFKGVEPSQEASGRPIGESFEISADDGDDEARLHPSVLELADGSTITLAALLAVHADALLGEAFVARYGRRFPLLPKLLDVAELLSVQAHPPGNTEVYVVIDAEPGATIRLGFVEDVDAAAWSVDAERGRRDQRRLLELVGERRAGELQELLKAWLARRGTQPAELEAAMREWLPQRSAWQEAAALLASLHETYWTLLNSLNEIPVKAGDVIYNANPERVTAASRKPRSAEVHALGNPEGRGVFALEIRHPGPTFRAWDNVRFPLRGIDIEAALGALSLRATCAKDFVVAPVQVRPGVRRSVDSEYFRLEHFDLAPGAALTVPAAAPHCLHALAGRVRVRRSGGGEIGSLARGEAALIPIGVGGYTLSAGGEPASVLRVVLPPYGN